jgi:hypothetical protein
MIPLLALMITAGCAFAAGFLICSIGTWIRVHRQESNIRALLNNIEVLQDMDGHVPTIWVKDQLESMLVKEFR